MGRPGCSGTLQTLAGQGQQRWGLRVPGARQRRTRWWEQSTERKKFGIEDRLSDVAFYLEPRHPDSCSTIPPVKWETHPLLKGETYTEVQGRALAL